LQNFDFQALVAHCLVCQMHQIYRTLL
jgi:hypothetical protein